MLEVSRKHSMLLSTVLKYVTNFKSTYLFSGNLNYIYISRLWLYSTSVLTNFRDILHRSSFVYRNRAVEMGTVYCNYVSLTEVFLQQVGIISYI